MCLIRLCIDDLDYEMFVLYMGLIVFYLFILFKWVSMYD